MAEKILVVDDEKEIADLIELYLSNESYEVHKFYNGKEVLAYLEHDTPDLAILDVMLPDMSGFSICQKIRETQNFPIIMLTAKDEEIDKITGLTLGADDYITKPFRIQVLKRRVEAVLRRGTAGSDCFDDGFLRLDFQSLTAARNGERLSITPNEYKLLRLLTANAGAVMTRRLLLEKLWDSGGNFIDDHTLTVTMNRLRAKIEDAGHTYIQTVRGMGYVWTGDQE